MKFCKIDGCDTKHYGLGYCPKHYQRFKKFGDPDINLAPTGYEKCLVSNCTSKPTSLNYCPMHYSRFIRHGNPNIVNRIRNQSICSIIDCSRKYRSLGFCNKHYEQFRLNNDPIFKLNKHIRTRLRVALKNKQKKGSAIKDLGCSILELKSYLEAQFQLGMTWNNYGFRGWHIDHIKPLSSFDLSNREELLKAVHYTNLQPLWARDNLSKSNKVE